MLSNQLLSEAAIFGTFEALGIETNEKREKVRKIGLTTESKNAGIQKNSEYPKFGLSYNSVSCGGENI